MFGEDKKHKRIDYHYIHIYSKKVQYFKEKQQSSFLGKRDLDGGGGGDLEALEGVPSGGGLHLRLELNKCNVVSSWDQSDLLETRELEENKM